MNDKIVLSVSRKTVSALFALYIVAALYLLYFSPFCGRALPHRSIQPVPFKTVIEQMSMPHGVDLMLGNILGNIAVLLPAGFFLALLGWSPRPPRGLLLFMVAALIIETLQFLFSVGCMDIDDVWMNGAGGLLGFRLGRRLRD